MIKESVERKEMSGNTGSSVCKFEVADGVREHSRDIQSRNVQLRIAYDRPAFVATTHCDPHEFRWWVTRAYKGETARARARTFRSPIFAYVESGGQSRDSLGAHRGKSAAVQPWNWNNGTVRGALRRSIRCGTVRRVARDITDEMSREYAFVRSGRRTTERRRAPRFYDRVAR